MDRVSENTEIPGGQHPFIVCYLLEVRDSSRKVEAGIPARRLPRYGVAFSLKSRAYHSSDSTLNQRN